MRRFAAAAVTAAVVALLAGCTPAPEHTSSDADVVAAREQAYAGFPDLTALATDDAVTRIADHTVDACGTAHSQQAIFGHEELGLRCTLSATAVFALGVPPDDLSAAAVVDAFLAANGATAATSMTALEQAAAEVQFAPPSSLAAVDDHGGPGFVVTLFGAAEIDGNLQYLPKNAGGGVVLDEGDWPADVESEARDTGARYFAVVESFVEYFNSDVATPTYGPSESGDENHNPPCYGTSGYCPGG